MSFYAKFVARSKSHAKSLIAAQQVPPEVKSFVSTAIENLPNTDGVRLILVEASGHLCASRSDSTHSSATIRVEPLEASE